MGTVPHVVDLVNRELQLLDLGDRAKAKMAQSTDDFFTTNDREQLYFVKFQSQQILREMTEMKSAAKDASATLAEQMKSYDIRIRALEDDRLQLKTKIETSWWWIGLISIGSSGLVNLLLRLFLK